MKVFVIFTLILYISAKEEITNTNITSAEKPSLTGIFVTEIARHYSKKVKGGDYVSLAVSSYSRNSPYNIYVSFKSEIPTYKIYYKYKSSNSDDVTDFILGVFTSSYSTDYVRNGTEYTFTLTWTHKSAKYLLFIPDELDGIDEYTIQNGEPLTEGEKLFRYIIFGIIGVLILVGVLIVLIKFRVIKCCC
jgi:hypothetical protein